MSTLAPLIISIPDDWSLELPSYNLVYNISPFPVLKPRQLSATPSLITPEYVWVRLNEDLYGLFDRQPLRTRICPLCGHHHDKEE